MKHISCAIRNIVTEYLEKIEIFFYLNESFKIVNNV